MKPILLLGGVTEALAIARTLGPEHIYSLAGVGRVPTDLTCQVRVGGYGGVEGLAQFVRDEHIGLILDATHPVCGTDQPKRRPGSTVVRCAVLGPAPPGMATASGG